MLWWKRSAILAATPLNQDNRRQVMTVSKAQQKAVNKYVRENYDRVNVNMAKGKKEIVQAHAEAQGESLNAFINRAITETMERDSAK